MGQEKKIYIDRKVVDQLREDRKTRGPEIGYILLGVNPDKYNNGHVTVLSPYQRTIGTGGHVNVGDTFFALRVLEKVGLYDDLTVVGWAHSHPWLNGHNFFSSTDIGTQTIFQKSLEDAIAIVNSQNGMAVYQIENGAPVRRKFRVDARSQFRKKAFQNWGGDA